MADTDLNWQSNQTGSIGPIVTVIDSTGRSVRMVIPGFVQYGTNGQPAGSAASPFAITTPALTAGTNRSGTATTTSGGLNVAANTARKGLVGENISAVSIGFNEFGGTAAIGTAGTYTVAAGSSFSISTNGLVNFIAASGTAAVTMTEY